MSKPEGDITDLIEFLKQVDRLNDSEWEKTLSDRKIEELHHSDIMHNPSGDSCIDSEALEKKTASRKFYSANRMVKAYTYEWTKKNCKDKIVLDLACGSGELSELIAQQGARLVVGLDLSPLSINNNRKRMEKNGVKNCIFIQGDCEHMDLPNEFADVVICSGMLHHVDLSFALPEIRRVLKQNGRVFALEALNYNPIIKLYRALTPSQRTHWESSHILSMKEVEFAMHFFDLEYVRFWQLATIPVGFLKGTFLFRPALVLAEALDRLLLKIPYIKYLAWIFSFELKKKNEDFKKVRGLY